MDINNLLIGIGVVAVIIAAIFAIKYFINNKNGREEAAKFLKQLEEQMYHIVLEIVNSVDIADYKTLEDYEKEILEQVYKGCWEFVNKQIAEAEQQNLLTVIAKKFLTKENVELFIRKLMDEKEVTETLENVYVTHNIELQQTELTAEDDELQEKYSNEKEYFENFDENNDKLEEVPVEAPSEEELANLNPQKDIDEEEFSDDDESVEVITDYIIEKNTASGAKRYYLVDGATGKKKQVSKQFVKDSDLEVKSE